MTTGLARLFEWCELLVLVVVLFAGSSAGVAGLVIGWHAFASVERCDVLFFLVGAWCAFASPVLYVQLAPIVDVIGTRVLGRDSFVPELVARERPSSSTPLMPLIWLSVILWGITSPMNVVSAIAFYALVPTSRPLEVVRLMAWTEARMMVIATERFGMKL